ncbi:hypothetical protein SAMN05192584_104340 [Streptomyces pini]|uniref:Uncharacterized protein n=1 Tax=Streptomyces pini TaxID=1520580 RepID=A0A1I3XVB0_9ACTN|nr:hypothetical protein SAMN05192584_104340 [Streptomyces pini]
MPGRWAPLVAVRSRPWPYEAVRSRTKEPRRFRGTRTCFTRKRRVRAPARTVVRAGIGSGDEALHTWAFSEYPDDRRILREATARPGAVVLGRRLFDIVDGPNGWDGTSGYGAGEAGKPAFAVLRRARGSQGAGGLPVPMLSAVCSTAPGAPPERSRSMPSRIRRTSAAWLPVRPVIHWAPSG